MNYLEHNALMVCENQDLSIDKPKRIRIDFIIKNLEKSIGLIIKDWQRAVGVDVVIRAERVLDYYRSLGNIMILTNNYSDPAKMMADRIGVGLVTKEELKEYIRNYFNGKQVV